MAITNTALFSECCNNYQEAASNASKNNLPVRCETFSPKRDSISDKDYILLFNQKSNIVKKECYETVF